MGSFDHRQHFASAFKTIPRLFVVKILFHWPVADPKLSWASDYPLHRSWNLPFHTKCALINSLLWALECLTQFLQPTLSPAWCALALFARCGNNTAAGWKHIHAHTYAPVTHGKKPACGVWVWLRGWPLPGAIRYSRGEEAARPLPFLAFPSPPLAAFSHHGLCLIVHSGERRWGKRPDRLHLSYWPEQVLMASLHVRMLGRHRHCRRPSVCTEGEKLLMDLIKAIWWLEAHTQVFLQSPLLQISWSESVFGNLQHLFLTGLVQVLLRVQLRRID